MDTRLASSSSVCSAWPVIILVAAALAVLLSPSYIVSSAFDAGEYFALLLASSGGFQIAGFLLDCPEPIQRPGRLEFTSANITEPRLLALAFGALFYVAIRFVEAYGLWWNRGWAAILGIASAGLYIPFEIIELVEHVTWISVLALVFNILVVAILWLTRPKSASR